MSCKSMPSSVECLDSFPSLVVTGFALERCSSRLFARLPILSVDGSCWRDSSSKLRTPCRISRSSMETTRCGSFLLSILFVCWDCRGGTSPFWWWCIFLRFVGFLEAQSAPSLDVCGEDDPLVCSKTIGLAFPADVSDDFASLLMLCGDLYLQYSPFRFDYTYW